MIEPYRSPAFPPAFGALVFAAALVLFVALQPVAMRLRAEEHRTWWASNGRDVVNALAVVSISASVWLLGIALPLAIFLGCTLTLVLALFGTFLHERVAGSWRLVLAIAAVLGAPLVIVPGEVAMAAAWCFSALFPG
ncbi:hypothetical protein [Vulgatibacter incomptus]|uniref:Uncharacterized protein n=1 Tax=Vulgatibacter incomptus TaxID=1391653 RepID=A0A0K1PCY7_9BACT|nr:hypothetical protein [Vulgatibacter incomptus]AKU91385.1 hypothetical protein AKJ08_1772 [Vulgatibacter incomptus]